MNNQGLPRPPKLTQAQCDEIAFEDTWNRAGRTRPVLLALSADDAASLDSEWRAAGHDKAAMAGSKKAPPDPYAGMTDEQRADAIVKARYEESEAKKRAKAFSDRIDREMGDVIAKEVLSRRGYSA